MMINRALAKREISNPVRIALLVMTVIIAINIPNIAHGLTVVQETEAQPTQINLFQAALVGILYYLASSPWLFGSSFYTIYRPLAAGLLVGFVFGDPGQGALIGAAINLVYLGFISAGGQIPGDPALAGYVGTALALAGGLDYGTALTLAAPIGLLGTIVWNARMTVDSVFVHMADKAADEGSTRGVILANVLYPQIWLFLITAVPVTIALWLGGGFIIDLINGFPVWVLHAMAISGGILPAIGIALNMRFIFRGSAIPYFFIGYFVFVTSAGAVPLTVIAVIGGALAVLHVTLLGDRVSSVTKPEKAPKTSEGA
ncbi:MAG: PTS sugar transporter subunit IIC [Microbacteriaceae bacterium]|nr:PTS sugar transporter subunit IIC [Microbacteriaceae bacterium]